MAANEEKDELIYSLKYRPKTFEEVIGNTSTVKALQSLLKRKDKPHAILFTGLAGGGKTTLARITANAIGVHPDDLQEIDITDFNGIATIRQIRREMTLAPSNGKYRAWILDEVHKLTADGQTGLLKTLEEPPSHVYFFMATNEPGKLNKALMTRPTIYEVDALTGKEIKKLLLWVLNSELGDPAVSDTRKDQAEAYPDEAIEMIVEKSRGCSRTALVLLGKTIVLEKENIIEEIQKHKDSEVQAIQLCRALLEKKPWKEIAAIIKGLKESKEEPESLRQMILAYVSTVLLSQNNAQAAIILDAFRDPIFYNGFAQIIHNSYNAIV